MNHGRIAIRLWILTRELADLRAGEPLDGRGTGHAPQPLAESFVEFAALARGRAVHPDRRIPPRQGGNKLPGERPGRIERPERHIEPVREIDGAVLLAGTGDHADFGERQPGVAHAGEQQIERLEPHAGISLPDQRIRIRPESLRSTVLRQIGADATGLPFNSIMAILLENDHPSTPLVNAGAIAACSMIRPTGASDAKWKAITEFIEALTGSRIAVIDELYRSESETNFNNRAIAWLLRNYGRIYDDPELSLDLYTRQCSLGVTARQLAVMAATIASGGVNPITHLKVFDAALTPKITALMATVGFYEHTGDWLYATGLPAKSGVGGGILAVVPGVMGLAAFAPPLDEAGNSVKAQKALAQIADRLSLGLFNTTHGIVTEAERSLVEA